MNSELEQRVRKLLAQVMEGPASSDTTQPFVEVGIRAGEMFTLIGEGFYLLEQLEEQLAAPAASGGGSVSSVRDAVLAACGTYVSSGEEAAIDYLRRRLDAPLTPWLVVRPMRSDQQAPLLTVGRCTLQRGLPALPNGGWPSHFEERFPHFSVATTVQARDKEAAKVVADQNIGEALAILRLTRWSWRGRPDLGDFLALRGDGRFHLDSVPVAVEASTMVDAEGRLWPHLDALSAGAAKESDEQTDWERRTLAAARWLDEAASSSWPSDALIAMMVALESLFVRGLQERNKGRSISREVSERWVLQGMTQVEQRSWLEGLYRRRNDAAHEGRQFEDDIDVGRLHRLCWRSVSWAASHLRPQHGYKTAPCLSQEEALSDHSSSTGSRA